MADVDMGLSVYEFNKNIIIKSAVIHSANHTKNTTDSAPQK